MKYKPDFKRFNLKAVHCILNYFLKSPLSGLEIVCKTVPGSVGLNIKLIMLKSGWLLSDMRGYTFTLNK